jgi:hypothetical protein
LIKILWYSIPYNVCDRTHTQVGGREIKTENYENNYLDGAKKK